jgi:prolyl-tRNA editing enzyme YbaK/EbsC (Cys-tRNA(Pro) deacylase)
MAGAVDRFVARAADLGVVVTPLAFPEGTRTALDAAAAIGCTVGAIVKSLVFVADGRPVLVLTSGANRVDEARLAAVLGAGAVRKADADEVRTTTGYAIGGTPPFGHDTTLEVLLDEDLAAHAQVWAAAGTPSTVFPIDPATLAAVTGARRVEVAAHG